MGRQNDLRQTSFLTETSELFLSIERFGDLRNSPDLYKETDVRMAIVN